MDKKSEIAKLIWETSRADEGTISATGADIIADALMEHLPEFWDGYTEAIEAVELRVEMLNPMNNTRNLSPLDLWLDLKNELKELKNIHLTNISE